MGREGSGEEKGKNTNAPPKKIIARDSPFVTKKVRPPAFFPFPFFIITFRWYTTGTGNVAGAQFDRCFPGMKSKLHYFLRFFPKRDRKN
jgi:hypothetical protein